MSAMPERPATRPSQVASAPMPTGETTPTPVTTRAAVTRRVTTGSQMPSVARRVERMRLDVSGDDPPDQAGEHAPGTDLDEVGHAVGRHAADGVGPLHAVDEVLGELPAQAVGGLDDAGVHVAEHRHASARGTGPWPGSG